MGVVALDLLHSRDEYLDHSKSRLGPPPSTVSIPRTFAIASRFATDSPLEGSGFELSVPRCVREVGVPRPTRARLLAIGRFLAQRAKSEVSWCVGRRDFERGPRWVFWRVRPIPEGGMFRLS